MENQIVPLHPEALPEVMAIWLDVNPEAHSFIPDSFWLVHYDAVQQAITEAEVYCWKPAEKPLAFIGLTEDYVAGLFVRPEWRRQGVGRALLAFARKKRQRLTLHVYRKNEPALHFYLAQGFAVTGSILEPSTGETALILQWDNEG